MFEKIRISLWDIFTFFLTGFFIFLILSVFIVFTENISFKDYISFTKELPATIIVFVAPLLFTLLGMLIEPLANYTDKYIFKYILWWTVNKDKKMKNTENTLKQHIIEHYLGNLKNTIEELFYICKEYVETNQLSTKFMVFLSRYGFYRNISFIIIFISGFVLSVILVDKYFTSCLIIFSSYLISGVFRKRSQEFYSYMAPTIYATFINDKNK